MIARRFPLLALVAVIAVALIGRGLLLASGSVSFHSDEAVVGLMARHILQGERPVFFYGQAYMGSLDAWLIAVGFALLGDTVMTIHVVESLLYLLIVATGFLVAWQISGRAVVATVTGLVMAVPTVLLALYTTSTLGGYNETLLLGNLVLLLGWQVTHEQRGSLVRWALLGICAGIGWWSNGLIVAYVLPVGVLGLVDLWRNLPHRDPTPDPSPISGRGENQNHPAEIDVGAQRAAPLQTPPDVRGGAALRASILDIVLAAVGFFVGSAPWWAFAFANDFAPLRFYLPIGSDTPSQFAGMAIPPLGIPERLLSLFALNFPVVIGLRFPWYASYFLVPGALIVLMVYIFALYWLLRHPASLKRDGRLLVGGMIGLFCALFLVSRFNIDPSGRYFLPMALPLGIALGVLVADACPTWLRIGLALVVIGYNGLGLVTAATTVPPGFTTQFNLDTHIPNDDDAALIAFLEDHGLVHGYTNYWISFRLAFLSDERLIYSATLSYKPDLSYTPFDDRDPAYRRAVDAAPDSQIAYITANVDAVRANLEKVFAARGVTYQRAQVGVYHVYYDFAPETPRPPLDLGG